MRFLLFLDPGLVSPFFDQDLAQGLFTNHDPFGFFQFLFQKGGSKIMKEGVCDEFQDGLPFFFSEFAVARFAALSRYQSDIPVLAVAGEQSPEMPLTRPQLSRSFFLGNPFVDGLFDDRLPLEFFLGHCNCPFHWLLSLNRTF